MFFGKMISSDETLSVELFFKTELRLIRQCYLPNAQTEFPPPFLETFLIKVIVGIFKSPRLIKFTRLSPSCSIKRFLEQDRSNFFIASLILMKHFIKKGGNADDTKALKSFYNFTVFLLSSWLTK